MLYKAFLPLQCRVSDACETSMLCRCPLVAANSQLMNLSCSLPTCQDPGSNATAPSSLGAFHSLFPHSQVSAVDCPAAQQQRLQAAQPSSSLGIKQHAKQSVFVKPPTEEACCEY
jgi:hypothetical protein